MINDTDDRMRPARPHRALHLSGRCADHGYPRPARSSGREGTTRRRPLVTIDAVGCQVEIAAKIVEHRPIFCCR